jgi:hypothetical protein
MNAEAVRFANHGATSSECTAESQRSSDRVAFAECCAEVSASAAPVAQRRGEGGAVLRLCTQTLCRAARPAADGAPSRYATSAASCALVPGNASSLAPAFSVNFRLCIAAS